MAMEIPFTKGGFEKLKIDLREAERKRPETLKSLVRARAMGDLSENGFYKSAKAELADLDRKIRHLKYLIKNGKIIQKPKNNDFVQIGHKVVLKRIN